MDWDRRPFIINHEILINYFVLDLKLLVLLRTRVLTNVLGSNELLKKLNLIRYHISDQFQPCAINKQHQ